MKQCKTCKQDRVATDFYRNAHMRDGRLATCRFCILAYQAEHMTDPEVAAHRKAYTQEHYRENKEEIKRKIAQHRRDHPDAVKDSRLKHWYGLRRGEYQERLDAQGGVCLICKTPPTTQRLHVDHDHRCCPGKKSCGKCVRGLLCGLCNVLLGQAREDPELLRKLALCLEGNLTASGTSNA